MRIPQVFHAHHRPHQIIDGFVVVGHSGEGVGISTFHQIHPNGLFICIGTGPHLPIVGRRRKCVARQTTGECNHKKHCAHTADNRQICFCVVEYIAHECTRRKQTPEYRICLERVKCGFFMGYVDPSYLLEGRMAQVFTHPLLGSSFNHPPNPIRTACTKFPLQGVSSITPLTVRQHASLGLSPSHQSMV